MLIVADETDKWAHVSIPKCACQSIRRALELHWGLAPAHSVNNRQWPCRLTKSQLKERDDLFRWSIVRDPRARLVSTWAEKTQRTLPEGVGPLAASYRPFVGCSFETFARWVIEQPVATDRVDAHIRACSWWLLDAGTCVVDAVYRLEELPEAWRGLQQRLGFPAIEHRNKSTHKPWREYFSPSLDRAVRDTYSEDFESWYQTA